MLLKKQRVDDMIHFLSKSYGMYNVGSRHITVYNSSGLDIDCGSYFNNLEEATKQYEKNIGIKQLTLFDRRDYY